MYMIIYIEFKRAKDIHKSGIHEFYNICEAVSSAGRKDRWSICRKRKHRGLFTNYQINHDTQALENEAMPFLKWIFHRNVLKTKEEGKPRGDCANTLIAATFCRLLSRSYITENSLKQSTRAKFAGTSPTKRSSTCTWKAKRRRWRQ